AFLRAVRKGSALSTASQARIAKDFGMRLLNPAANCSAIVRYLHLIWARRELTWELTRREFTERYAGQIFGALWAIAHPLIVMLVYVFVFNFVYKAKMDSTGPQGLFDFSMYILSGLVPWMAFAEVLGKSTSVITGNGNLVKQVIFPIEVLPTKTVLASFITQVILTVALMTYSAMCFQILPWSWCLAPFLLLVQLLGMLGFAL